MSVIVRQPTWDMLFIYHFLCKSTEMKSMRAKKSLGQHFLRSTHALNKIVEAASITSDDVVLEIGPGKGALTQTRRVRGACHCC